MKHTMILSITSALTVTLILPTQVLALNIGNHNNAIINRNTININVPVDLLPGDSEDNENNSNDNTNQHDNENESNDSENSNTNNSPEIPIIELPTNETVDEISENTPENNNNALPIFKKRLRNKNKLTQPQDTNIGEVITNVDTTETESTNTDPAINESTDINTNTKPVVNEKITKPTLPRFERTVGERLPITLERYRKFLQDRSDRAQQTDVLSDTVKQNLKDTIKTEDEWLETKVTELATTDSIEERRLIKKEIRAYIEENRKERRKLVEQNLATPKNDSIVKAETISTKFTKIIEQFDRVGIDTTELESTITRYNTTVAEAKEISQRLETQRTLEDIQALRERIATIRELSAELRNQVQTILVQENN